MPATPAKSTTSKKEEPKQSLMTKALTKGSSSDMSKDEILDIIFWFRCIVSFIFGLAAGISGLTGSPVIVAYGVFMITLNSIYTGKFLEIEEDDFNP